MTPGLLEFYIANLFHSIYFSSKSWSPVLNQINELVEFFYKNRRESEKLFDVQMYQMFDFDYTILKYMRIARDFRIMEFGFLNAKDQFRIWGSNLLLRDDQVNVFASLAKIKEIVKFDKSLSPRALTLINHKLSKLSHFKHQDVQPEIFSSLLNVLPIMAKDKCCVSAILSLINLFSANPAFGSLRLKLLYQLWQVEPRCYNILEKNLLNDTELANQKIKLHYLSTKSYYIAKICQENASTYGANFLKTLTDLMNSSEEPYIITNSLSGILSLCSEGVIDIITTVKVLVPKFKSDQRLPIAQKFYELLSLAPTFHLESDDFMEFLKWCLSIMWKNLNDSDFSLTVKPCIIQR